MPPTVRINRTAMRNNSKKAAESRRIPLDGPGCDLQHGVVNVILDVGVVAPKGAEGAQYSIPMALQDDPQLLSVRDAFRIAKGPERRNHLSPLHSFLSRGTI